MLRKTFTISSPDGNLQLRVDAGKKLQWSVTHQSQTIIAPSSISLTLQTGEVLGANPKIRTPLTVGAKFEKINNKITALNYKKDIVEDNYNQLTLNCKGDYGVIFRAYNDGVAYRFFTKKKDSIRHQSEEANLILLMMILRSFLIQMIPTTETSINAHLKILISILNYPSLKKIRLHLRLCWLN